MSITGNIGIGVVALLAADTKVLEAASDRQAISLFHLYNTGTSGTNTTVDVYLSQDGTSAGGDKITSYSLADGASQEVIELIGLGLRKGDQIICVASQVGINCTATYTQYS